MSNSRPKTGDSPVHKPLPGQTTFLDDTRPDPKPDPGTNGHTPDAADVPSSTELNPFDPARYRLGTNYAELIGTQEHLLEVPVRKPGKEAWFRVHPDPAHRLETAMIEVGEDGGDREAFLVDPSLWPVLAVESVFGPRLLVHYQTRQGVNGLWPIKLPRAGDKINPWTRSALQAVLLAEHQWVRLESDRALGAYTARTATGITDEPRWPDYPFSRLLELAFRDRRIASMDHAILRRLRGEA
jgi:hypothetical protein